MLNEIEKSQLNQIADQYLTESWSEHHHENEDNDCIGCRKMDLSLLILKFVRDFSGS